MTRGGAWVTSVRAAARYAGCAAVLTAFFVRLGRGVPNKVLEALSLALPVVATPNAAAGLALEEFEGAAIAADAEPFAAAVVARMRAAAQGRRRYPQHRDVLRAKHRWHGHMERLRRVLLAEVRDATRVDG